MKHVNIASMVIVILQHKYVPEIVTRIQIKDGKQICYGKKHILAGFKKKVSVVHH